MKKDRLIHNSMHDFNAHQEQGKIAMFERRSITEKCSFSINYIMRDERKIVSKLNK